MNMDEITKIVGTKDYYSVTSNFEQFLITIIFKKIIKKGCFYLDFDENDSKEIVNNTNDRPIRIKPPSLFIMLKIIFNPEYQICESYVQGKWFFTAGNIIDFILLLDKQDGYVSKINNFKNKHSFRWFYLYKQYIRPKPETRKSKEHYDLNPSLYQIFLGDHMLYSCAFFDKKNTSLNQAQKNKLEITMDRLAIDDSSMNILDIGCGWGTLVNYIAQNSNANVHGISIAKSQIEYANIEKDKLPSNVSNRIFFSTTDYDSFKLTEHGYFDRIVSIGMLEHVGKQKYSNFFKHVSRLLKPGGIALIHTITKHGNSPPNEWIDKYIFPGGYIPKYSEVVNGAEKANLLITESSHFHSGENYIKTLQAWSDNFIDNIDRKECVISSIVRENNYKLHPDRLDKKTRRFIRMWYFYLNAIQTIFMPLTVKPKSVHQFIFKKL